MVPPTVTPGLGLSGTREGPPRSQGNSARHGLGLGRCAPTRVGGKGRATPARPPHLGSLPHPRPAAPRSWAAWGRLREGLPLLQEFAPRRRTRPLGSAHEHRETARGPRAGAGRSCLNPERCSLGPCSPPGKAPRDRICCEMSLAHSPSGRKEPLPGAFPLRAGRIRSELLAGSLAWWVPGGRRRRPLRGPGQLRGPSAGVCAGWGPGHVETRGWPCPLQ